MAGCVTCWKRWVFLFYSKCQSSHRPTIQHFCQVGNHRFITGSLNIALVILQVWFTTYVTQYFIWCLSTSFLIVEHFIFCDLLHGKIQWLQHYPRGFNILSEHYILKSSYDFNFQLLYVPCSWIQRGHTVLNIVSQYSF